MTAYIVKRSWMLIALTACVLGGAAAPTMARDRGCDAQRAALEQEISYARQYGNTSRVQGLERALAEVNARCPGASVSTPAQQAVPANVAPVVPSEGCAAKKVALEREIAYAREYGNTHRVQGLERAMVQVNAHCTDAGVRADLLDNVADKEDDVRARERELDEAIRRRDADKIIRRTQKLEEARQRLAEARARLDALPQ